MDQIKFEDTELNGEPAKKYLHYVVLKDGRIWLSNKERFAKISVSSTGYAQVFFDGMSMMLSHVIVLAWYGTKPSRVSYKNFDVKDNRLENLIWR